jgi:hypothetical protein
MSIKRNFVEKKPAVPKWYALVGLQLCLSLLCQAKSRQWTVYLAQDKHLDYNWCGSTDEIEQRMVALLDYYLNAAERNEVRWNLDGTLWNEVYRRHRSQDGGERLLKAIRRGRIGYAGNYAVLLWGILDTETAIRACYGTIPIEKSTAVRARTALVTENPGMTWGIANILTDCSFDFLARGIYPLRAESYNRRRERYPLFWWRAPNGKRILVRWDMYQDTKSWGGYAEAHLLASMAGEKWNAYKIQSFGDRNTDEVFQKRKKFIEQTVSRYEGYGDNYPISSILLMGTGWDNWTKSKDLSLFCKKFNERSNGAIRIVDARYEDFFIAAEREIKEKGLELPILEGSFGICWEEWAAHLAGLTADFREAERLLRLAEASHAIDMMAGRNDTKGRDLIRSGFAELLKFAEHDFGGTDRKRAALSAAARTKALTQARNAAQPLAPKIEQARISQQSEDSSPEETTFQWRGGPVIFEPNLCAVVSLRDSKGRAWVEQSTGLSFGQFKHTLYHSRAKRDSVLPKPIPNSSKLNMHRLICRRTDRGVRILAEFEQSGFQIESKWFFHEAHPWIDITYKLKNGWSEDPQTVEFCFPLAIENPTYRYDAPGAVLIAGPKQAGGDDLPGANPELFAGVTFAAASEGNRTALVLTPDCLLLRFGRDDSRKPAQITSMPMMNLTGNDWQFGQGDRTEWTYRYRIVLLNEGFNPLKAFRQAQRFATPPFLQVPGESPVLSRLEDLNIDFPGGPLLSFKVAEDNRRLVLRFWNVMEETNAGSLILPVGWQSAEMCDALERPLKPLVSTNNTVRFSAEPLEILTIALRRDP